MMQSLVRPVILIAIGASATLLVFAIALSWYGAWDDERKGYTADISDGYCNIAVIPIQGDIVAYENIYEDPTDEGSSYPYVSTTGDWVVGYLHAAEADPGVGGILVTVDSYGGQASPALEIMDALESSPLPVIAYIREAGTSAAYLSVLGADHIVGNPFASVGSIGVTYSYLDQSEKNAREGIRYVQLSSGPYKDAGSPDKPLTESERALFERDIATYKDVFVDLVAEHRDIPKEKVVTLADGDAWPAPLALERGLIDAVGNMETVRRLFANELGIGEEDVALCN